MLYSAHEGVCGLDQLGISPVQRLQSLPCVGRLWIFIAVTDVLKDLTRSCGRHRQ